MGRWIVIAVFAAACGRVPAPAPTARPETQLEAKAHYIPGERALWEVRWLGVKVGKITMAVGQPGVVEGRPAITVRYEVATAGVVQHINKSRAEIAAILDTQSAMAIKIAGGVDHLYAGRRKPGQLEGELKWRRYRRHYFLEQLGTIGAARGAWKGKLGSLGFIPVKIRYKRFHLEMTAVRRERVYGGTGKLSTVRIEGVLRDVSGSRRPENFPYVAWISDDERKMPVRVHMHSGWIGTVKVELAKYSRPRP